MRPISKVFLSLFAGLSVVSTAAARGSDAYFIVAECPEGAAPGVLSRRWHCLIEETAA